MTSQWLPHTLIVEWLHYCKQKKPTVMLIILNDLPFSNLNLSKKKTNNVKKFTGFMSSVNTWSNRLRSRLGFTEYDHVINQVHIKVNFLTCCLFFNMILFWIKVIWNDFKNTMIFFHKCKAWYKWMLKYVI